MHRENRAVENNETTTCDPYDGHPKCVESNKTCADKVITMCEDDSSATVDSYLLLWDSTFKGAEAFHQINKLAKYPQKDAIYGSTNGQYQLCLASDCVYFQEFHDGLLTTIARTLEVDGLALLCQPKRGTSLQNFINLVNAVNTQQNGHGERGALFQITLFEDFYPKVSAIHKSFSSEADTNAEQNTTS